MIIRLICAECKRLLKVPEEALNKKVLCPACGAKFIGLPSLVRVKRQPEPAAAGSAAAPPARTRPDQPPAAPRSAPVVSAPPPGPPAAPSSPPPSEHPAPFDFPRLELDPSSAGRRAEPQEPEIVESLDDLVAEPAPAEPEVVEEVPEVAFLHSEGTDSEVVDLTETHPEVLEPEVVSELEDDVIVPEVVEPEPAQTVEALEPEIVEPEMPVLEDAAEPEVVEAAEPEVIESASLEPEVVEAAEPEVVEAAAVEPEMPVPDEAAEPEVVEADAEPEVVETVEEAPARPGRRPVLAAAEEEEDEPVAKKKGAKKQSNKGLLVGCLVGGLLLVLLTCGGGIAAFIYLGKQASNATTGGTRMSANMTGMTRTGGPQIPPPNPGGNPPPQIPAGEWKAFSPPGGNFTVEMPGTPIDVTNPENPQLKAFDLNRAAENVEFTIFYQDQAATEKNPTQAFEQFSQEQRDLMTQAFNGKPGNVKAYRLGASECREVVIEAPQRVKAVIRTLLSKQGDHYRMYQLIAAGPDYRVDAGDAARFFNSFRVRPPRRPRGT